ncbi:MAG: uroporphyrinogen decarboxylase family protein [Pirellulaceae bacterium]
MKPMNSLERVRAVLTGRIPDRVPVALHNYLMACRMADADLSVVLRDGEALAAAQLAAWRQFGHDVIMHENGVHAEAEAMGCGVLYQSGIAPHVEQPVVTSLADIDRLHVPDPETTFPLSEVLKATRVLVAETMGRVYINGRADQGPMALALALCGPERFLTWVGEPESRAAVHRLLDTCSRMNIAFAEAQIRAGAHSSTIGLAGHSLISPITFDELELPRAIAFCEAVRRCGASGWVHACGNETGMLPNLVATGAACIELDPGTDPVLCKRATQGRASVLGMLHPVRVLRDQGVEEVRCHTRETMRWLAPGGGFMVGPGCALPPDTPPANIHAVLECARSAGCYAADGSLPNLR